MAFVICGFMGLRNAPVLVDESFRLSASFAFVAILFFQQAQRAPYCQVVPDTPGRIDGRLPGGVGRWPVR